jgi:hypothetical protein
MFQESRNRGSDEWNEEEIRMQSDFEFEGGLDEPLDRGRLDEEEPNVGEELMRAAQSEFRELPVTLPGDSLQ